MLAQLGKEVSEDSAFVAGGFTAQAAEEEVVQVLLEQPIRDAQQPECQGSVGIQELGVIQERERL
jgi:hypothetical protein